MSELYYFWNNANLQSEDGRKMSKLSFAVIENHVEISVFGLLQKSNDRTQAKDIPAISKKYYETVGKESGEVIPFIVISKDYNASTKDFQLFIGGVIEKDNLETFVIPKGIYGKVTVKPKMGFLWGLSIGEAKRAFYTEWLPKSDYTALNMEYEYHTEISTGRNPQIDILFYIEKRNGVVNSGYHSKRIKLW
ncbi:MAG: GyrI-like domain-containing protein [Eubacteriaceae bacterium]|nr:GyrI-like domain-containing protein [Eubacteriaceae bacterium]